MTIIQRLSCSQKEYYDIIDDLPGINFGHTFITASASANNLGEIFNITLNVAEIYTVCKWLIC